MTEPMEVVYCPPCFGSGTQRKRDMIGTIRFETCKRCHGKGDIWAERHSGLWRIGKRITFRGSSPGIRKGRHPDASSIRR